MNGLPPCDHDECPPTHCARAGASQQRAGSPSLVGSEFLIARWEAKAEALEEAAERDRSALMGLVAMNLEKARAYRACIKDLRRHEERANQSAKENA